MTTTNIRVATYLPHDLYEKFCAWKDANGISSESLAVYRILGNFLGSDAQEFQSDRIAQLEGRLEDRITRLEQLVDSMAIDIYGDSTNA